MDLVTCEDGHRKVAYKDIGGGGEQLQCPVREVLAALIDTELNLDNATNKIRELQAVISDMENE
jgi:hypothetical protein